MPEQFYKENYPIVYGYLLSLCGDVHMAEELAAETFCRALEKLHRYNPAYKRFLIFWKSWKLNLPRECRSQH